MRNALREFSLLYFVFIFNSCFLFHIFIAGLGKKSSKCPASDVIKDPSNSNSNSSNSNSNSINSNNSNSNNSNVPMNNSKGRIRSFSDCTSLPPMVHKVTAHSHIHTNKRGPQTIGSGTYYHSEVRQRDGIADNEFVDDRLSQHMRNSENDRHSKLSCLPPFPRSQEGEYYTASSAYTVSGRVSSRRHADPAGSQYSGLMSLQTCSHPVGTDPLPPLTGWYSGNSSENSSVMSSTNNSEKSCRHAMDIVTRDDTDNSQDSSESVTPNPTPLTDSDMQCAYITRGMDHVTTRRTITTISSCSSNSSSSSSSSHRSSSSSSNSGSSITVGKTTISGVLSDARAMFHSVTATATTTPNTAFSTPDISPLPSPYR